jgi:hypothetical protein
MKIKHPRLDFVSINWFFHVTSDDNLVTTICTKLDNLIHSLFRIGICLFARKDYIISDQEFKGQILLNGDKSLAVYISWPLNLLSQLCII